KEKVKKKRYTPDLLEDIAKETFSRKLVLTLSEAETIDYGNEKIE
ncbi:33135_t:CDS:1, partial [Gigaspora margarita]